VHPSENPALARLLAEYRERLSAKFGARLVELRLFGSYARGTAREDSDVDVAVVLDRVDSHAERVFPMELAGALVVEHGLVIVPIVLSTQELEFLRAREELLAANLDREGIVL
jgi:predicted nucleotidyltransferase